MCPFLLAGLLADSEVNDVGTLKAKHIIRCRESDCQWWDSEINDCAAVGVFKTANNKLGTKKKEK
jgi:hypothetical protein